MSVKSDMMEIIDQATTQKTSAYDSTAEVTRVEGDTIWVHLAGGVTETPVRKTINARPGDTVQVRVSGGRAWIQGNETNPPTDDTAANKAAADAVRANAAAQSAVQSATTASVAAADAQEKATTASTAAATALTKAQEAEDSAEQAATAAATADSKATAAGTAAAAAQTSADNAASAAATADSKADAASAAATRAETKADTASAAASRAETAAGNAESAAASAQTSADGALVGLSTVQDVVGVLNWITAHGTMTSQSGETFDADQVYFIQDNNGDYTVGGVRYSLVAEPKAADINSYYVLTVHESVQNYVATHIVVDSEGLWIIPDAGGNKVLIATGNGSSYTTAGTYIIGKVNNVDKVLAKFITTGATVGQVDGAHSIIDAGGQRFYASDGTTQLANIGYGQGASESGTATAPYYTLGTRNTSNTVGNYSVAEGYNSTASGYTSHAEGYDTIASNPESHAEGLGTTASGQSSHAEGESTIASGFRAHAEGGATTASGSNSHAQNFGTIAAKIYQTAIGKYNLEDTEPNTSKQKAFIIGNGTDKSNRSNAFTVDWEGNTEAAGDITDGSGNVLADKADSSSLATVATSGDYDDLSNTPNLAPVATSGSYNDLTDKPTIPTASQQVWYGTSSTSASTATKIVRTTTGDFDFKAGNVLYVRFTQGNTSSASLYVTVDGTQKQVYFGNVRTGAYYWGAYETLALVYSGSYFYAVNQGIASTDYYGMTKLENGVTSTSTSTSATPYAVKQAFDRTLTHYKEIITSYSSGWTYYGNNTECRPVLRVCGNVVNLKGALTNTASKTLNATATNVFSIPSAYAPSEYSAGAIFSGSGSNRYWCEVTYEGVVNFSRYTNGTSYSAISSGAWFPFNLTWIIDD